MSVDIQHQNRNQCDLMLPIYVAADQVPSLEKDCRRVAEMGVSYTKIGIKFDTKAAQLVRDEFEDLDLALYSELDTNAKPTGGTSLNLILH